MWSLSIDTGGTFTDCLARDPAGRVHRAKVLSNGTIRGRVRRRLDARRLEIDQRWPTGSAAVAGFTARGVGAGADAGVPVAGFDPGASVLTLAADAPPSMEAGATIELGTGEPAPVVAARLVTGTPAAATLPDVRMRLGTTRGTNALLERRGAPTALFITEGFGDLTTIGDQQRPDLFALRIVRTAAPCAAVVEVPERLDADGAVVRPLDLDRVAAEARRLRRDEGIETAAVALMHAYRNDDHERRVAACLRDAGFRHVSCSAALAPLIRLLPRAETAIVDAYLAPVIGAYVERVRAEVGAGRLHLMTSAGGLIAADRFRPRDSLLSGPAGGVAGAAAAGRRSGCTRLIGLDMGGTSTDVARYDGDFVYTFEQRVGGVRLLAPALDIETVAAGGGSVCRFAGGRLRVGPRSAGADPGPACYGAGGPLTLTDVNLLAGRLDPEQFAIPVDPAAARATLDRLVATLPDDADPDAVLDGFLEIADERMAAAIERVSLRRGDDPADHALLAFGGAGGQHACAVAERLGMRTVILPADASLLSAVGLDGAVVERFGQRQVLRPLAEVAGALPGWFDELAAAAAAEVIAEGVDAADVVVRRRLAALRLAGQDAVIEIEAAPGKDLASRFADRYAEVYGHPPPDRPVELESIRVAASSRPPVAADATPAAAAAAAAPVAGRARARFGGARVETPVHRRAALPAGATLAGPALVLEARTALVVETGWRGRVDEAGAIVLRRDDRGPAPAPRRRPEVVVRELFTHRFEAIAEEMGRVLERTSLSTNVKERLDFSCTLLDAGGRLLVNAPHMPVHLGAMGLCVRALMDRIRLEAGDVVVTNHPACGGSHLPDITVVTPVVAADGRRLGFVASRAHHAEIGGTRPGSMPPDATTLVEEGVVIPPTHLVDRGRARFDEIERRLREAPYPSRAVADNLADLRAQVAANQRGAVALRALADVHGADEVAARMEEIAVRAEAMTRRALRGLGDGRWQAVERLDDGAPLAVTVDVRDGAAVIDFAGSAPQHAGNLNATPAIVRSAVIYVFRLLAGEGGEDLPLNEGIMRAIDLRVPPGLLAPRFHDDPAACPAVVGGNVETSQRLVDTLLKALGRCACSQGTMNNTLFGSDRVSYYETVCGGSGAGPGFDGCDAVHTHMTNTRITDPEILEHRYPVRVERFAIRRGSGGAGRHRGGDGAIRELRFLAPMTLSLLAQHRREGPYGLAGGAAGVPGAQRVVRRSGEVVELGGVGGCEVGAGDRLVLETPGGGGFGPAG